MKRSIVAHTLELTVATSSRKKSRNSCKCNKHWSTCRIEGYDMHKYSNQMIKPWTGTRQKNRGWTQRGSAPHQSSHMTSHTTQRCLSFS